VLRGTVRDGSLTSVLLSRVDLILILVAPGTRSALTQQAAADAVAQRSTTDVVAHQPTTLGHPTESTTQFASTPSPSGADAPYPDNHSFDAENMSLGNPIAITFNPQHLPTTVEDARGNVTTLAYDYNRNLVSKTDPLSHTTSYG
jgi:YD repeat-containing protein